MILYIVWNIHMEKKNIYSLRRCPLCTVNSHYILSFDRSKPPGENGYDICIAESTFRCENIKQFFFSWTCLYKSRIIKVLVFSKFTITIYQDRLKRYGEFISDKKIKFSEVKILILKGQKSIPRNGIFLTKFNPIFE